jgi:hypothetical protein
MPLAGHGVWTCLSTPPVCGIIAAFEPMRRVNVLDETVTLLRQRGDLNERPVMYQDITDSYASIDL